uniref:A to I editase domain-containing protein n=1 Tax=Acrobeloides nanus TaxID=290746 RepID=A0A914DFJ4_9BILA
MSGCFLYDEEKQQITLISWALDGQDRKYSRLCRREIFRCFHKALELGLQENYDAEWKGIQNYHAAKVKNKSYNETNILLKNHLNLKGYGQWLIKNPVFKPKVEHDNVEVGHVEDNVEVDQLVQNVE